MHKIFYRFIILFKFIDCQKCSYCNFHLRFIYPNLDNTNLPTKLKLYIRHICKMTKDREINKDKDAFCKLFVGNLKFSTTTEDLRDFYSTFGEIVDCVVMKDSTGKSRGFGFVTYQNPESVDEAQRNRPHYISGRKTEPKRAIPRGEADKPEAQQNINKIFIGGLLEEVNEAELEDYFSTYGKILNTNVIRDSVSGKKRGFAYLTLEDYDTVDKIVLEKYHTIHGKTSEVRKALSKEEMRNQQRKSAPRKRYNDREEDDYNNNDMMMPGNFLGGPVGLGGGSMMDEMPLNMGGTNGMMMGNGVPFDMLANMGMMSNMMGGMMGTGMNSNPASNSMGGNFGSNSGMSMGGMGMGSMLGGNSNSNPMAMMGMSGMGMNDGGMGGGFNSGFANNMPSTGGYSRNQSQGYGNNMGSGPMRDRRSGNGFSHRNKPYNDNSRGQGDRGFAGKRGGGGRSY